MLMGGTPTLVNCSMFGEHTQYYIVERIDNDLSMNVAWSNYGAWEHWWSQSGHTRSTFGSQNQRQKKGNGKGNRDRDDDNGSEPSQKRRRQQSSMDTLIAENKMLKASAKGKGGGSSNWCPNKSWTKGKNKDKGKGKSKGKLWSK